MTMKEIHVMLKPQILLITSTSAAAERKTHGEKKWGKHHFTNRKAKIPGRRLFIKWYQRDLKTDKEKKNSAG